MTDGDVDKGLAVKVKDSRYLVNPHSIVVLLGVLAPAEIALAEATAAPLQ